MTKTEIESKCLSDEGRDSSILSALSPERHRELFDRVEEAIWECEEAGNICSHLHCAYIAGFSRDEVDAAIACMMTIALVRMPIDELARA